MSDTSTRFAVVTSRRRGYASRFVEYVIDHPSARRQLAAVILARGPAGRRAGTSELRRVLRKLRRIGIGGAAFGYWMRRWYKADLAARLGAADIADVCRDRGVPVIEIASFSDADALRRLRDLDLDVAVSMGNGYIPQSFFSIPRRGMLNIHHELLPAYRGAQTALWQIHNGSRVSGFTIHVIDDRIDHGDIVAREEVPLELRPSLRETVVDSTATIQLRSVEALARVLEDLPRALAAAEPNQGGQLYTTPSSGAMLRIFRQHRRLLAGQA